MTASPSPSPGGRHRRRRHEDRGGPRRSRRRRPAIETLPDAAPTTWTRRSRRWWRRRGPSSRPRSARSASPRPASWNRGPASWRSHRTSRGGDVAARASRRDGELRPPGRRRQRQHRRGVGRVPLRRGPRLHGTCCSSASAPGSAAASSTGGRLFRGAHGFAAEIGHIIVDPDGPLCGCGNHGCWEQFASGQAVMRAARAASAAEADPHRSSTASRGDPRA